MSLTETVEMLDKASGGGYWALESERTGEATEICVPIEWLLKHPSPEVFVAGLLSTGKWEACGRYMCLFPKTMHRQAFPGVLPGECDRVFRRQAKKLGLDLSKVPS